ncbi:hypothetical protein GW17_00004732, partial [Ensete ventricosum]
DSVWLKWSCRGNTNISICQRGRGGTASNTSGMSAPPKQRQEITRDALLEKLAHERELRSYQRRASAAALFIQVVTLLPFSLYLIFLN